LITRQDKRARVREGEKGASPAGDRGWEKSREKKEPSELRGIDRTRF